MKEKTKELADSVGVVYPVLFMGRHDGVLFTETELETFVDLVAAAEPPQREWQGLTNEDWVAIDNKKGTALDTFTQGAVWAESQLRERNT